MSKHQVIRIDLLEVREHHSNVGVVEWRNYMESTDNGVYFLHPRRGLRLPDRIDDAAMAARGENDQTLALDDEVGADLVLEIVQNVSAGVLHRRHLFGEASEAVNDPNPFR